MSMSQFASGNNVYFEFYPNYCLVKDILIKEILLQGNADKGMYKFNHFNSRKSREKERCCNLSVITGRKNNVFDTWHSKLGHPNANIVKHVLIDDKIPFENIALPYVCTYYQMSKSHKLSFTDSQTKYEKPLELVAADLWDPASVNSDYGFN